MMRSNRLSRSIRDNKWHSVLAFTMGLYCLSYPGLVRAGAHDALPGPFTSSAEVSRQCISCHESQAADVQKSVHWTWERTRVIGDQTTISKKGADLTRFGLAAAANAETCRQCHIGINSPEPQSAGVPAVINCLVCHDTTGTWKPEVQGTELEMIVRAIGTPSAQNCQSCHDQQCGLTPEPGRTLTADIHIQKLGFSCQNCHPGNNHHQFKRTRTAGADLSETRGCESCHTPAPHALDRLNQHAVLISCQSCHIPSWGNNSSAVTSWNWLLAESNQALTTKEGQLLSSHGFARAQNLTPLYFWDNGSDLVYSRGERIHPEQTTILQKPGRRTPTSKIMPFSVQYGTQFYDAKYRYLISPQLSLPETPFFNTAGRTQSIANGMRAVRLPYSGQYGVTTTVAYRRLNHGVTAAENALDCMDCHGTSPLFDWQSLGYENDPWFTETPQRQKPFAPADTTNPAIELPPIEESVLPATPY